MKNELDLERHRWYKNWDETDAEHIFNLKLILIIYRFLQ